MGAPVFANVSNDDLIAGVLNRNARKTGQRISDRRANISRCYELIMRSLLHSGKQRRERLDEPNRTGGILDVSLPKLPLAHKDA
jgi:hypothetical protein